jgi:asparagine synthase (glutamine-hydrolysing)
MCGIFGLISIDGNPIKPDLLQPSLALTHRGPNGSGKYWSADESVYFHHSRLAVIDTSNKGSQPMTINGVTIVFNGMVYNYGDLKVNYLNGSEFIGNSDTEVVLRLYLELGQVAFSLLKGMFAICLWDSRKREFLFFRDELGIKPLYLRKVGKVWGFASEPKALLDLNKNRVLNSQAIADYLVFQTYLDEFSLMKDIEVVVPGVVFKISDGNLNRISNLHSKTDSSQISSIDDFKETLRSTLPAVVLSHLTSDVPVTTLLSGGLDSTLCLSLISKLHASETSAYTGNYPDFPETSEIVFARLAASKTNSHLNVIDISKDEYFNSFFSMIDANDFPIAGPPGPSLHFILSKISRDFRVAIGGLGGDELFFGYARHWIFLENIMHEVKELQGSIHEIERAIGNFSNYKFFRERFAKATRGFPIWKKYAWLLDRTHDYPNSIQLEEYRRSAYARFENLFNAHQSSSPHILTTIRRFDLAVVLPGLLQVDDRASMSNGVELRVPLLDSNLLRLVEEVDPSLLLKFGPKGILKETFKDLLPREILSRDEKHGFPTPFNKWSNHEFSKKGVNMFTKAIDNPRNNEIMKKLKLDFISPSSSEFSSRSYWGPLNLFCSIERLERI